MELSSTPSPLETLLLVDDDSVFRTTLAKALTRRGFQVLQAGDATAALEQAQTQSVDRAVVDLCMPGASGLELIDPLRTACPGIRIVVLTGYGSIPTAVSAMQSGAVHYLTKPADADTVLEAFDKARPEAVPQTEPSAVSAPPLTLAEVEWQHIQRIMRECKGNVSQAARRLGMHRRSLQRKLARGPLE
ncbi:MAG: response regulator [Bdellovibrionales bacterium]|nr:response regulator [Bdellovibrionales bacterium]